MLAALSPKVEAVVFVVCVYGRADIVMAHIVLTYIVMAYIVMAYIVMARFGRTRLLLAGSLQAGQWLRLLNSNLLPDPYRRHH